MITMKTPSTHEPDTWIETLAMCLAVAILFWLALS